MPYKSGSREAAKATIQQRKDAVINPDLFVQSQIINNISKAIDITAVKRGPKLAYPNGVRLKYENVSLM